MTTECPGLAPMTTTTTATTPPLRWSEERSLLERLGATPALMEACRLLGAGARAAWRVQATLERARSLAASAGIDAVSVLAADELCEHSDRGALGAGLGTGRRHAMDGAAWMAAAEDALLHEWGSVMCAGLPARTDPARELALVGCIDSWELPGIEACLGRRAAVRVAKLMVQAARAYAITATEAVADHAVRSRVGATYEERAAGAVADGVAACRYLAAQSLRAAAREVASWRDTGEYGAESLAKARQRMLDARAELRAQLADIEPHKADVRRPPRVATRPTPAA